MRVLVTGGAGFIGSHFVHRLAAAGDEVVVLGRADVEDARLVAGREQLVDDMGADEPGAAGDENSGHVASGR
jgi:nucleoside-diphosphate-sugar epimerase